MFQVRYFLKSPAMNTFSYLRTAPANFFKASVGLILNNLANAFKSGVTVIWGSPRYGYPHSQNPSDIGIPCNPNLNPNQNR